MPGKITLPTREGYTFSGYYSESDGLGTLYYNSSGNREVNAPALTSDLTLFALWHNYYNVSLQGGNCTIKSVNNTNLPANSITTTIPISNASNGVTIVVQANTQGHLFSNKIQVTINGTNEGNQFDVTSGAAANGVNWYSSTKTISINGNNLTGDVTITCPTYVISDYKGSLSSAFSGYKCITFDNAVAPANGRWIIIGANGDSETYGAGSSHSTELDPGQVLLLSEAVLENRAFDNQTYKMSNWTVSDIRAYLNGISIDGNDETAEYANNGFYQNSGLGNYNVVQKSLRNYFVDGNHVIGSCKKLDYIFLLSSFYECGTFGYSEYLGTSNDARLKGANIWWLRSNCDEDGWTGDEAGYIGCIDNGGEFSLHLSTDENVGVRPAFVLDLNDIPAPTVLGWMYGVAYWHELSLFGDENTTYSVQLYRDNIAQGDAVIVMPGANSCDFTQAILNDGYSDSEYTFTVQAILGNTRSAVSGHSDWTIYQNVQRPS